MPSKWMAIAESSSVRPFRCLRRRGLFVAALALGMLSGSGCDSSAPFDFHALGLVPVQETLAEFSLGKYTIPIPVMIDADGDRSRRRNRFQFEFELHVLVTPEQKAHLSDAWNRHQGQVRDRVLRTCRNASVDDLQEAELGTLKSHLTDVVQSQLGKKVIRHVLITDIVSQEL